MDIPDFIGMRYNKAQNILTENYPHLKVKKVIYNAKFTKLQNDKIRAVEERVVRQKILSCHEIELTVSHFPILPIISSNDS